MHQPLAGPRLKVERAEEHLNDLQTEIRRFLDNGDVVDLREERDLEAGELLFRVARVETPPVRWSLVVGDVLHNLRSALDHLTWELSDPAARDKRTAFPIFVESDNGELPARAVEMIPGLSDDHRAIVESMQPYNAGNRAGDEALAVLRALSNADKHRFLHLTVTGAAGGLAFFLRPQGVTIDQVESNLFGPLEVGAVVVRYAVSPPDADVQVPFGLTTEVALRQGETPWTGSVVQILSPLCDEVSRIISRF